MNRRIAAIAFAAATSLSQPPTPSPRPSSANAQQEPTNPKAPSTIDKRGTDESPVVVRVLPTPVDQEQTAQEQRDRENETANKQWVMILSGLTVLVGIGQLWMIGKQASISEKQNQIIDGQTTIMREQAKHMADGLEETRRSVDASILAADAATEANQISRNAVIADQRPWIALDVELAGPISSVEQPVGGWHVHIAYRLHNHGRTPATYVDTHARLIPHMAAHFPDGIGEDGQGKMVPGTDLMKEINATCTPRPRQVAVDMGLGHVIFPGETAIGGWKLAFPSEATTPPNYMWHFLVLIGVNYGSTMDQTNEYLTAKAFLLVKLSGDRRLKYTGEPLGVADVGFQVHPFGTGSLAT